MKKLLNEKGERKLNEKRKNYSMNERNYLEEVSEEVNNWWMKVMNENGKKNKKETLREWKK